MRTALCSRSHRLEDLLNSKLKKKTKKTPFISGVLLLLGLLLFPAHASPSPEMESEISRRILWGTLPTKYVSYEALRRDRVPCDRLGAPYYSCHEGGALKANPYARGCSRIAGCRG